MPKLSCMDYGFECDFVVDTKSTDELIDKFGTHTLNEHGIDYSREALMQFLLRKHNSTKFEDVYVHAR